MKAGYLLLACGLASSVCRAAFALTVGLAEPKGPSPRVEELATRLSGELAAVGFSVRRVAAPAELKPGASTTELQSPEDSDDDALNAMLTVANEGSSLAVEIWTLDEAQRVRVLRVELAAHTDDAPGKLAIHAVEVLRSALLEIDLASEPLSLHEANTEEPHEAPAAAPAAPKKTSVAAAPAPREPAIALSSGGSRSVGMADTDASTSRPATVIDDKLGVSAGVFGVVNATGVGPSVMPNVRLDAALFPDVVISLAASGLGTRPALVANGGRVRLAQNQLVMGARYRFWYHESVRPFVGASVGTLLTAISAEAELPRTGHSSRHWALLLDGNVGTEVKLLERGFLTLSGHVQFTEPSVAVHIVDELVATSGRPNIGLNLSVGVWL